MLFISISCAVPVDLVCSGSLVILASASGHGSGRGKGIILSLRTINHEGKVCLQSFMDRIVVIQFAQEMVVMTVQVSLYFLTMFKLTKTFLGFTAMFCTYYVIDVHTGNVLSVVVANKRQAEMD